MKPIFFYLGDWAVHGYGLAVAVGFAAGMAVALRQARRAGFDLGAMMDLFFWILLAGILGARASFVLLHLEDFARLCRGDRAGCGAALRLWDGGLVFHGGVLAAFGASWLFCRRRGWRFGAVADVLAPALALGHALGRLGCFLAGCCYGRPVPWGLRFPTESVAFEHLARTGATVDGTTVPLHPTQLYEAVGELMIFAVLLAHRKRVRSPGSLALLYALLYGVLRFGVELFRGDRTASFPTPAQITSTVVAICAAGLLVAPRRRAGVDGPPARP